MSVNTSVRLGDHYSEFVNNMIAKGRYESTSEAIRAALKLLEQHEQKSEALRKTLEVGIEQLDRGEGIDGATFMDDLIKSYD